MSVADRSAVATSTVGIIVNPHAGKDIRRLVSAAGHVPDSVKIGIVRRVVAGAIEQGARRLVLSADSHRLTEQALDDLPAGDDTDIDILDNPLSGSHLDTIFAAREMCKERAGAVVTLGGDGTCRDVATGWPDVPLIALSTGTNNVFPSKIDGTSAGVAAALVATGAVVADAVSSRSKRVALQIDDPSGAAIVHEGALVEAALIDTPFVGARAVTDPSKIRWVVACLADPASTGLASIAGRIHPVDRSEPGGVLIRIGTGGRRVRVPLAPGRFTTIDIQSVEPLRAWAPVELRGGGVLAYDGERTTPISAATTVTASVERSGPLLIDVTAALAQAASDRRFDTRGDDTDGD
jgi:predicted polyphosphate/ATP-dependent NAD kinase